MDVAPAESIALLRQNDDAAAFRRLIRKGGQLGRIVNAPQSIFKVAHEK